MHKLVKFYQLIFAFRGKCDESDKHINFFKSIKTKKYIERIVDKMENINFEKDFFTVNEFASVADTSAETLRHYDRKGIFKPSKRGENSQNIYRLYSPAQITTMKMLHVLTDIGVHICDIEELAENRSPEALIKLLHRQKPIVAEKLRRIQAAQTIIETHFDLLIEGISATETEITIAKLPEMRIILGNKNDYTGSEGFYRELMHFCGTYTEPRLNLAFPMGGYYESIDEYIEAPSKPTHFFSIDPCGKDRRKAGLYMVGYARGYYGQPKELPSTMCEYAEKNGLVFCGPVYNITLPCTMKCAYPTLRTISHKFWHL